jgi:hypothetical protein
MQAYFRETGKRITHRYDYDLKEVAERKQELSEFLFYRKKFEKSQRAKAEIVGESIDQSKGHLANLDLNEEMFDP